MCGDTRPFGTGPKRTHIWQLVVPTSIFRSGGDAPLFLATMLVAVRCALRYVASIITVLSSPCSAVGPTVIRAKMPFSLQHFQRL